MGSLAVLLNLVRFSCSVTSGSFVTPWTVAHQAPLSMGFSRQEYWSGLPLPSPEPDKKRTKWPGALGWHREAVTLAFGPHQAAQCWVQGAEIRGQTEAWLGSGRLPHSPSHPRLQRAWGWRHAGVPVATLANGRELPPRVSAGFPDPAPGQKPAHPVSLSTRPPSALGPSTGSSGKRPPPCKARAGQEEPDLQGPTQARTRPPGNRGAGETPARRATSPTPRRGTSAFPPAQGRGAGSRRAGPCPPPLAHHG